MRNFVILFFFVIIFSSCVVDTHTERELALIEYNIKSWERDGIVEIHTPEKIEVRTLEKGRISIPDCNGNECYYIYTIIVGTKREGNLPSINRVHIWQNSSKEKSEVEKKAEVEKLFTNYNTLLSTEAEKFRVEMTPTGLITKIYIPESTEQNVYIPEAVFYQRKKREKDKTF